MHLRYKFWMNLLCFYLHFLFLLYIKEWLEMLIFKMERYGIKNKFLIDTVCTSKIQDTFEVPNRRADRNYRAGGTFF